VFADWPEEGLLPRRFYSKALGDASPGKSLLFTSISLTYGYPLRWDVTYTDGQPDPVTPPVVLTAEKLSKTLRSPTVATFPDPATVVPMRDWYATSAKLWNVRFPTVTEDPNGAGATAELYLSKALTGTGQAPTATVYGYAGGVFVKEAVTLAGRTVGTCNVDDVLLAPFARFETNFDPYTGRAFGRTFKVGVSKKF
jgi:hypothetical protein